MTEHTIEIKLIRLSVSQALINFFFAVAPRAVPTEVRRSAMSKIIVGIHGLANKPPKDDLTEYWRKSIAEGLRKNCAIKKPNFDFRMVYWADLLYKN